MSLFGGLSVSGARGTAALATEAEAPQVNVYTAGVSFGVRIYHFFLLGGRGAYSQIDQTSKLTAQSGNRSGTRMVPLAPLLGVDLRFARLLADFQMSGDYELSNADTSGNQITYKKPSGLGLELLFNLSRRMGAGFRYERVDFSQEQTGSASAVQLPNELRLQSYGLVVDFHF